MGSLESISRLRPGASTTTDRYGNAVPGTPTTTLIEGCRLAPGPQPESRDQGRQGRVHTFTVYAPPGTDVEATDLIEARGATFTVDGPPSVWGTAGVAFDIRRTEG